MTRTFAPCVASCARVEILIKSIGFARLTPKNEKLVQKALDVMNIYTSVVVVAWVKYCIFNR